MKWIVFLAAAAAAAPAMAQDARRLASELGTLIASEEICGLTYDQQAIAAWIEEKVPADDMAFADNLNSSAMLHKHMYGDQSASARTAHCAAVSRTAKHYGFTQ